MINTPFDSLNYMKGKKVTIIAWNKKIEGTLVSFDLNQNVSIETKNGLEFVSGISIKNISLE